ncbi:hypothetical protein MKW92_012481 [Papaver armeniacum]|nr:hypothetical protein MKW92_012481 [Papaver armeniacum]
MAKHLFEASVMGFSLFLAWMTDCLHHYIVELRLLRKSMEAVKKQTRGFDDAKNGASKAKAMEEELTSLKANVKKLESECETKKEDVLEDNQNLVEQFRSTDRGPLSHSIFDRWTLLLLPLDFSTRD